MASEPPPRREDSRSRLRKARLLRSAALDEVIGLHVQIRLTLMFSTASRRREIAAMMGPCPHVLEMRPEPSEQGDQGCGHRPALELLLCVPEDKKGWALALARDPSLIGATHGHAEVLIDTPDRSGELRYIPAETPPCGSDCTRCPQYLVRCGGCPVTPLYKPGYRYES